MAKLTEAQRRKKATSLRDRLVVAVGRLRVAALILSVYDAQDEIDAVLNDMERLGLNPIAERGRADAIVTVASGDEA